MHKMKEIRSTPKFVILEVINPHHHSEWAIDSMDEAEKLVTTFGGRVVTKSVQHRVKPDPSTYIGSGKLEWLKQVVKDQQIDVVVVNGIVNSGQLFRLEKELWQVNTAIKVWDRVDLILHIFEQHAKSTESKLQIELARIEHSGPRIFGLGLTELSRQGGGIGTRGKGETNIEVERRLIKDRKRKIQKQLKQLASQQHGRIKQRQQKGLKTAALVGYTSAGKTTLFNCLTGKSNQTSAALFTTLESVVGRIEGSPSEDQILVSDTIGFIENLPPSLIETFKSTLLESLEADVVIHVVDVTDSMMRKKIETVEEILSGMGLKQKILTVLNKSDQLDERDLKIIKKTNGLAENIFVSAKTGAGVKELINIIAAQNPGK